MQTAVLSKLFDSKKPITLADLRSGLAYNPSYGGHYRATFITFVSKTNNPLSLIENERHLSQAKSKEYDNFYLVRATRHLKAKEGKEKIEGTFALLKGVKQGIWHLISDSSLVQNEIVSKIIEYNRPRLFKTFFSTNELLNLLDSHLFIQNQRTIVAKKLKTVLQGIEEDDKKIQDYRLHDQIFEEAQASGKQIIKFEFEVRLTEKKNSLLNAQISRDGTVKYYKGDLNLLWDVLLPGISKKVEQKTKLLSNRARRQDTTKLFPIEISFETDVFNSRLDNNRFIQALTEIGKGAVSVFHNNPYLHVSYLDFYDGSNFDIFATNSKKLSIVPGFQSSEFALSRLCESINAKFQEGKLSQSEFSPPSVNVFWNIRDAEE